MGVNVTLSRRGDYVLRSALALARAHRAGEHRKIREVVAEMGVPSTFASQILADLVHAGLASSKAGRDGGYRLRRPPAEISLLEVVEAAEGPLCPEECAAVDAACPLGASCPLRTTWQRAVGALRAVLATTTLADLTGSAPVRSGTTAPGTAEAALRSGSREPRS
jgi:Rrf2 family protein